jgi:hypothetical protein
MRGCKGIFSAQGRFPWSVRSENVVVSEGGAFYDRIMAHDPADRSCEKVARVPLFPLCPERKFKAFSDALWTTEDCFANGGPVGNY